MAIKTPRPNANALNVPSSGCVQAPQAKKFNIRFPKRKKKKNMEIEIKMELSYMLNSNFKYLPINSPISDCHNRNSFDLSSLIPNVYSNFPAIMSALI